MEWKAVDKIPERFNKTQSPEKIQAASDVEAFMTSNDGCWCREYEGRKGSTDQKINSYAQMLRSEIHKKRLNVIVSKRGHNLYMQKVG